ncbi:MAG TPA: DJ-1 family glyoxalase III [Candidatus Didemnitutus sp.]|nr:DJ-1 family glyoxalase III [Candidatus Didemnitutus sp.]
MPTVLVILAEGFEEIEALAPVDLLRRAGVEVRTASLTENRMVKGRSGIVVQADVALAEMKPELADMIFLPGGPGVKNLRADPRVAALARKYFDDGRWVAAICAAPTVLHDAGLLKGRRYTAHFSVADELKDILSEERVVDDGRLTTSRGAGTAVEFGLHLVALLISDSKAAEISKAICL